MKFESDLPIAHQVSLVKFYNREIKYYGGSIIVGLPGTNFQNTRATAMWRAIHLWCYWWCVDFWEHRHNDNKNIREHSSSWLVTITIFHNFIIYLKWLLLLEMYYILICRGVEKLAKTVNSYTKMIGKGIYRWNPQKPQYGYAQHVCTKYFFLTLYLQVAFRSV